jgi:hypothetical protein
VVWFHPPSVYVVHAVDACPFSAACLIEPVTMLIVSIIAYTTFPRDVGDAYSDCLAAHLSLTVGDDRQKLDSFGRQ